MSHLRRAPVSAETPVHVTLRVRPDVVSLRGMRAFRRVRRSFEDAHERFGLKLVHYSVQGNHLHLLVEAPHGRALSRGVQGLTVRIAKRINALMRRAGAVFADRFHASVLTTSLAAHRALRYVLNNRRRHLAQIGERLAPRWLDPFSSAAWFDGWYPEAAVRALRRSRLFRRLHASPAKHLSAPASDLLTHRWAQHGLIAPSHLPEPSRRS